MDTELMLDVGQANELKLVFRRTGWTNADIKKLCGDDILAQLLPVVRGCAKVILTKHVIDCDADPFLPAGWEVEEHKKGGQLEWDATRVALYRSPEQQKGEAIRSDKLREQLAQEPVLNANVLDWLLAHPGFRLGELKGQAVLFWGTIYRIPSNALYVRFYYRDRAGQPCSGSIWVNSNRLLDYHYPAALLASPVMGNTSNRASSP